MSSNNPPADTDLPYQRWEPAALESLGASALQMPTAADLEDIHQQAHQEGYEDGYKEGMAAGRRQGDALVAEEIARLKAMLAHVSEAVTQYEETLGGEMLALTLEIARQLLRQALRVKPELVLPIVRGAMESLPQNTAHPHLHLHPDDAALVRAGMQAEIAQGGWKVIDDPRVMRGGCRIETPVSEVNATIETRWQRIAASLGQDSSWLDE